MHPGAHRVARVATFAIVVIALAAGKVPLAHAGDRVAELAKDLSSSSSDKTRLAAVTALGRLGDKRALKPLVGALVDPNPQVRGIAAVALGNLGHRAALPALRNCALDDTDATVRQKAREATLAVAKANSLPDGLPVDPSVAAAAPRSRAKAGFGNQPHAIENRPDLYVTINSATDDSPGNADKTTRKVHAEIVRLALAGQCRSAANVTSDAAIAQRWGLNARHIDLSVVKIDVAQAGQFVEVEAQLRLAISDGSGRMMSFLSGGAKVQVPRRVYDARNLPTLRREALENAMRGMFDKLLAHLRNPTQS
jgi:hypothetical protein